MYEIAEPTPLATLTTVQPTTRLSKIRHRRQFTVHRLRSVPPRIQRLARRIRRIFVLEPRVDVSDEVVVVVVADDDLLDLAVLAHLAPEVLVEGVEVVL